MIGGPSMQLARVFGVRIGVHASWFVVLGISIFVMSDYFERRLDVTTSGAYLVAVAAVLLFFASLILHELGHAIVARRAGIGISGIDLWFFGGVAKLSRDSQSPGEEFRIAAAGPLVTLIVVAICLSSSALIQDGAALEFARLAGDAQASPTLALLGFLATMNGILFVFNLIPAFPLDG
ncbi:MAG TPA: site-2 protease family protein, partial [Solirubrobacteraceae bacterium]|nr:site-2 protease family protein [Solirubrobacteraceae bacterium]